MANDSGTVTRSTVVKSSSFNPALNKRTVRSGRYLLPKRKPPTKLNQYSLPLVVENPRPDNANRQNFVENRGRDVKLKEIIEARPPLRTDLSTPGPWAYSPHITKPLNETNAPSYTMRSRCWAEKDFGGRTSWSKTWYQSPEVWSSKVNFGQENVWPSPSTYDDKLRIGGEHQSTFNRAPAFTMGHREKISLGRPQAEKEPSPVSYSKNHADGQVYHRAPTIIHSDRPRNNNLWGVRDGPGPASYSPRLSQTKKHQPAFSLGRASREGLEPLLGPFASS